MTPLGSVPCVGESHSRDRPLGAGHRLRVQTVAGVRDRGLGPELALHGVEVAGGVVAALHRLQQDRVIPPLLAHLAQPREADQVTVRVGRPVADVGPDLVVRGSASVAMELG